MSGTTKQSTNGRKKKSSLPDTTGSRPRHASAATSRGMKTPVFFSQNQTTFSSPCTQPNSQPKNCPARVELSRVTQNICGNASNEAAAANTTHGRHTFHTLAHAGASPRPTSSPPTSLLNTSTAAPCKSAMHAPTNIITTKLCACTSGSSPAMRPAASIGLKAKGKRQKAKEESAAA